MLDIKFIRNNLELVNDAIFKKLIDLDLNQLNLLNGILMQKHG